MSFGNGVSGIADFRARLLRTSMILASLVQSRASDEITRLKREAERLFGDDDGALDVEALANPAVQAAKFQQSQD